MHEVVLAADERKLAVESWGTSDGIPVFLLHGTPGSRHGPRPRGIVLHRLNVRLISYDRPGYGGSDRHPGRIVRDAAADIRRIADHFGIDRFSVVGRSGGGPHALAAMSALRDRVEKAAVLVSLAPPDAKGLDWYAGMTSHNVEEYQNTRAGRAATEARLVDQARRIKADPEGLLRSLRPELTTTDRRIVEDVVMRRLLTETYAEAFRESAYGWIDDVLALRSPWGFDLDTIKAPTLLWHGQDDTFSPVRHTQWLAEQIPNSELFIEPGAAHFAAMEILPRVLTWITAPPGAHNPFLSDTPVLR